MLDRLQIWNYRTLDGVALNFGQLSLLLGENGSGKTSVLDALRSLQLFLSGDAGIQACFPAASLTRWQLLNTQRFELEGQASGVPYKYELAVEFDEQRRKARVQRERLTSEGKPLFEFSEGKVQLYRDDGSAGPAYPLDWTKSGLSTLSARPDNTKLTAFKNELARMLIIKPCPVSELMREESRSEEEQLGEHGASFVSWYRYVLQSDAGQQSELIDEIRRVFEGFDSLKLTGPAGGSKRMTVRFRLPEGVTPMPEYGFEELSDGQRMLILLYTLLYGVAGDKRILFIDEPDNYLSPREVQPWLTSLTDLCGRRFEQAVVVSHHPETINYLADRQGIYLTRDGQGPTRVVASPRWTDGLTPAETLARGWVS